MHSLQNLQNDEMTTKFMVYGNITALDTTTQKATIREHYTCKTVEFSFDFDLLASLSGGFQRDTIVALNVFGQAIRVFHPEVGTRLVIAESQLDMNRKAERVGHVSEA